MKKNNDYSITIGSTNVYADLGFPNPEEWAAKAQFASQISNVIKQKKLTKAAAAKLLAIDEATLSSLNHGDFERFSLDSLFRFLVILGQDVTIVVTPKRKTDRRSVVKVVDRKITKKPIARPRKTSGTSMPLQAKKKK